VACQDVDTRAWDCCGGQGRDLRKLGRGLRSGDEQGGHGDAGKRSDCQSQSCSMRASRAIVGAVATRWGQFGAARRSAICSSVSPAISAAISIIVPSLSPAATRSSIRSMEPGG
jgi:hypothetical protein